MFKKNEKDISKWYKGDVEITKMYRGDTEVWKGGPDPRVVAVCYYNGKTWYSTNMISCTMMTGIPDAYSAATRVAYGNGVFVCGGASKGIYYSTDGENWILNTQFESNDGIYAIAFGSGKFVMFARKNTKIYTSTDGISWTDTGATFTSNPNNMVYGNGLFVAVGSGKYYSSDGITWNAISSSSIDYSYRVEYGNGYFLAWNTWNVLKSTNGNDWTWMSDVPTYGNIGGLAYGSGKWLLIFDQTQSPMMENGYYIYSTDDCASWNNGHGLYDQCVTSLFYANGYWYRSGSGNCYYLKDSEVSAQWGWENSIGLEYVSDLTSSF